MSSWAGMHPLEKRTLRIALVLWRGGMGGAQSFTADLARALKAQGAEPSLVFVLDAAELGDHLSRSGIPYSELRLPRGRAVLRDPRRFARAVSAGNPDIAILTASGYLSAALRIGGFRAPIVAIEHGSLLQIGRLRPLRRLIIRADRLSGVKVCSAVVAVSNYLRERIELTRLRKHVVCIPNGVDLQRFSPSTEVPMLASDANEIVIGCAARLIDGKGVEDAIQALSHPSLVRARLRIAGDGPRLQALKTLAISRAVDSRVEFLGSVRDMPEFWRSTDLAVVPSNRWVESFGIAAVEAMACGKPVVASDSGALPDVVADGETGRVVPAGEISAFADALGAYVQDSRTRILHGSNARRRCEDQFGIDGTATRYLDLCKELLLETRAD